MTASRFPPFDFDVSAYPSLPRARGLLVTGTDTEIGKTLIAGAIARHLRWSGRPTNVFKPVATGCRLVRGELVSEDAEFLAACADSAQSLADIAPVRYAPALAPNVAADRTGRPIDLEAIFAAYARAVADDRTIVVEGTGGLLCPISDDFWIVHLARMMALPVVIVARAGLGTINHTLLTIHAARSAGLRVAGVVINRYAIDPKGLNAPVEPEDARGDFDMAMHTNPKQIERRGQAPVLALAPDEAGNSVADARIGEGTEFAIGAVDWWKIIAES